MGQYGLQAKLRDHWNSVVALAESHEYMALVEDVLRGRPECRVRMLDVCNRKVQEHITLKEAHKIYKHLFDEYGQRALMAERQEGVDWKAMMHALRVCREAEEMLLHHTITYPRPEAELLLRVQKGELPYREVAEMLEQGLVRLEECQRFSTLPEKPNHTAAEELVEPVYRRQIVDLAAA